MTQKEIKLAQIFTRARFEPKSINDETRTIQVQYTTGASVERYGWDTGVYLEELDINPGSVRLERLNLGAPLLNNHNDNNLTDILGVVESANETHATIRFSDRPEVEPIWNDVRKGIIRNISVGYIVHRYLDVTPDDTKIPVLRAVDWEPLEISLVTVPADAGAQVRNQEEKTNMCVIESSRETTKEVKEMSDNKDVIATSEKSTDAAELNTAKSEGILEGQRKERERVKEIRALVSKAKLNETLADKLIADGDDVPTAQRKIWDAWADTSKEQVIDSKVVIVKEEVEKVRENAQAVLLNRFNSASYKETGEGEFRNMNLFEMGKFFLRAKGEKVEQMSRSEIVTRSLHTNSDFPLILAAVTGKTLRDGYLEESASFTQWTRQATLPDLKLKSILSLSEAPNLSQVVEGAEYTSGTMTEGREQYKLLKYGKIIAITDEIIINDDLDAFTRVPQLLGAAARRKEGDIVYDILLSNPTLADSVALFHASHSNLTDALLDVDGLGAARALMRKQKGLQGLAHLNINPAFLIVGPDQQTTAEKLMTNITPAQTSQVNPFLKNAPQVIVESRIANGTADNFYFLAASPNQVDTIEYGYLAGQTVPQVTTEQGFEVDGLKIKVKHFFGAKAVDFRGLVKSTNDAA